MVRRIKRIIIGVIEWIEDIIYNRVSLFSTIWFNFHYLPLRQAIHLPIYLHHPKFYRIVHGRSSIFTLKGYVKLESKEIKRGMIRLGFVKGTSHPDSGFMWANAGTVIFKGNCEMAQGCSIRNNAQLVIGKNVTINANTKIVSYHYVNLGDDVRISWDCFLMDTNFHCMKDIKTGEKKKPYAPIKVGARCWIAQRCVVLNGVVLPENTTISSGSILTKRVSCEPFSILSTASPQVVSVGKYYRDFEDDYYPKEKYLETEIQA